MNDTAKHRASESRPGITGTRVGSVMFVAIAVAVALALFFAGTHREPAVPESLEVSESQPEPAPGPRRLPRSARPDQGTTVRSTAPALTPPPADSASGSSAGPVGIHAFPPLGTRPQLTGIIVPDDFELPPGYVRHYQSSDDGQRLAPILMFDPVNPPLDADGEPIEVPPDRIVPPELAPPGLPIDLLEPPEPPDSDPRSLRGLLRPG